MRVSAIVLVMFVLCLGCNSADDARRKAAQNMSGPLNLATETEYFTTMPPQGRPPDGKFPSGTTVRVINVGGPIFLGPDGEVQAYLLVRSDGDVEAYIAVEAVEQAYDVVDAVKNQENKAMDVSGIVEGGNKFALDLYQQLRTEEGNLFFSPSSISTAMAMTYAGAAGNTKSEMAKALHFQMPDAQLHSGMKTLQTYWTTTDKKKGIRLNLANRLWGQDSYKFLPEFLGITRDNYNAEIARLDFAQSEQSRQTINGWIEDQTENKITDLIPEGVLNLDTRLVLTNAVYFKGIWTDPFKKELTKEEDFHLTSADKIKVPMMNNSARFRYGEVGNLQILELPYGDGSLSMLVLLPKKVDGLADLEAKLTFENLQQWIGSLSKREVKVALPKFKTTSQFKMNDILKSMGMNTAFDPSTADFSGMDGGGTGLFISAVFHKAFVDVNEEGTEAAAATGVMVELASAAVPTEPPVFRADHPFIFMIRDNRNGSIMFMGRIRNPMK
jgi:serpin B